MILKSVLIVLIGNGFNMAEFDILEGPVADDDKIVIHLGHLSQAQYDNVVESVIAFMNQRWPNLAKLGVDS